MGIAFDTAPAPNATQLDYDAMSAVPKGVGSSVFDSFQQGIDTPLYGLNILSSKFYGLPQDSGYQTTLQALQLDKNQTPDSVGKSLGDFVGNMAGTALSPPALPLTIASLFTGGAAGAVAGKVIGGVLEDSAPELLGQATVDAANEANAKVIASATTARFSAASLAAKAASITPEGIGSAIGSGVGATEGQSVLPDVASAYNPQTNQISQSQFMSATKSNLGYGIAFGVADLALGMLFRKGRDSEINTGTPTEMTDKAAPVPNEDIFSPQENDFLQAHAAGASADELTEKAHAILNAQGIETDKVADTANMPILSPRDIHNIAQTFPYETLSQLGLDDPDLALTNFIVKNGLDKATSNDQLMDALRGHIERAGDDVSADPDVQIAKAITAYADENKPAARTDVVDHLKAMLDEKSIGQERVRTAATVMARNPAQGIHDAVESMTPEDLLKAAKDIPKENRAFTEEIAGHIRTYKKISGAREAFDQFVSCMMGEK